MEMDKQLVGWIMARKLTEEEFTDFMLFDIPDGWKTAAPGVIPTLFSQHPISSIFLMAQEQSKLMNIEYYRLKVKEEEYG